MTLNFSAPSTEFLVAGPESGSRGGLGRPGAHGAGGGTGPEGARMGLSPGCVPTGGPRGGRRARACEAPGRSVLLARVWEALRAAGSLDPPWVGGLWPQPCQPACGGGAGSCPHARVHRAEDVGIRIRHLRMSVLLGLFLQLEDVENTFSCFKKKSRNPDGMSLRSPPGLGLGKAGAGEASRGHGEWSWRCGHGVRGWRPAR